MDYEEIFVRSWDAMERRCAAGAASLPAGRAESVQALVREMRRQGYDRVFRAGMSVYDIVLSRAAKHDLRNEQPSVRLHVSRFMYSEGQDGRMEVWCGPGRGARFVEDGYQLTPRLEAALADLVRAPID